MKTEKYHTRCFYIVDSDTELFCICTRDEG